MGADAERLIDKKGERERSSLEKGFCLWSIWGVFKFYIKNIYIPIFYYYLHYLLLSISVCIIGSIPVHAGPGPVDRLHGKFGNCLLAIFVFLYW